MALVYYGTPANAQRSDDVAADQPWNIYVARFRERVAPVDVGLRRDLARRRSRSRW